MDKSFGKKFSLEILDSAAFFLPTVRITTLPIRSIDTVTLTCLPAQFYALFKKTSDKNALFVCILSSTSHAFGLSSRPALVVLIFLTIKIMILLTIYTFFLRVVKNILVVLFSLFFQVFFICLINYKVFHRF